MVRVARRSRLGLGGLVAVTAAAAWAPSFVAPFLRVASTLRGSSQVARHATQEEEAGGFASFLKVEQDIELTQEEFDMALEQECLAQRQKYYIGGDIRPNNLVVPWKEVKESEIERDARRALKKNGIRDPSRRGEDEEDTNWKLALVGYQDVRITWTGGEPGKKVGYIVERKPFASNDYKQIASYEDKSTSYLLARFFLGHEYKFTDDFVVPGSYSYRVLVRMRSGEVKVLYQEDFTVPEMEGVSFYQGAAIAVGLSVALLGSSFILDPPPKF